MDFRRLIKLESLLDGEKVRRPSSIYSATFVGTLGQTLFVCECSAEISHAQRPTHRFYLASDAVLRKPLRVSRQGTSTECA